MSNATLVSATLAGTMAAVVESTVTYPLEYVKTRRQMAVRPVSAALPEYAIPHLKSVFFQGWSPFVVGNALKTVLRFSVFNSVTKFMTAGTGQTTAPAVVVSGMITGIAETLALVPFESVKVTMIEASSIGKGYALGELRPLGSAGTQLVGHENSAKPGAAQPETPQSKPKATAHKKAGPVRPVVAPTAPATKGLQPIFGPQDMLRTVRDMYRYRGLRAFVQGFNPTVTRQVTNSALRFTSWNMWMQFASLDGEQHMSLYSTIIGSGVTAAVEALASQPIDVIKTRMQTANGRLLYGNSLVCAYRVFTEEGRGQLWAGLTPRFIRKWVGGGIIWAVYELSSSSIDGAMREHPFQ